MNTCAIWTLLQSKDKETSHILTNHRARPPIDQYFLTTLASSYIQVLAKDRMQILNNRLDCFGLVDTSQKFIYVV